MKPFGIMHKACIDVKIEIIEYIIHIVLTSVTECHIKMDIKLMMQSKFFAVKLVSIFFIIYIERYDTFWNHAISLNTCQNTDCCVYYFT